MRRFKEHVGDSQAEWIQEQSLDMSSAAPMTKVVLSSIFTSVSRSLTSTSTSSRAIRMADVSTYFERKADVLDAISDPRGVDWAAEQQWQGRMFFNVLPVSLAELLALVKVGSPSHNCRDSSPMHTTTHPDGCWLVAVSSTPSNGMACLLSASGILSKTIMTSFIP